jgi:hypothetical protein
MQTVNIGILAHIDAGNTARPFPAHSIDLVRSARSALPTVVDDYALR